MIAAILIWPSPKKDDERLAQAPPTVPEYLIVAWLCGNVHKLIIIIAELFISTQNMWILYLKLKRHLCLGMIKLEVRRILGEENLKEYVKDMWKVMDLGTTCLYVIVIILRLLAYFKVSS
jgi:hypothetical protein